MKIRIQFSLGSSMAPLLLLAFVALPFFDTLRFAWRFEACRACRARRAARSQFVSIPLWVESGHYPQWRRPLVEGGGEVAYLSSDSLPEMAVVRRGIEIRVDCEVIYQQIPEDLVFAYAVVRNCVSETIAQDVFACYSDTALVGDVSYGRFFGEGLSGSAGVFSSESQTVLADLERKMAYCIPKLRSFGLDVEAILVISVSFPPESYEMFFRRIPSHRYSEGKIVFPG